MNSSPHRKLLAPAPPMRSRTLWPFLAIEPRVAGFNIAFKLKEGATMDDARTLARCAFYATSLRLNSMLLSARLWRVTTVVCAVLALNFLSLWVDRQEWATQLIK